MATDAGHPTKNVCGAAAEKILGPFVSLRAFPLFLKAIWERGKACRVAGLGAPCQMVLVAKIRLQNPEGSPRIKE